MKKLIFVSCFVLIAALAITFLPVHGEGEVYDSVVRLHVVANSDGADDQNMKIAVRDAVLDITSGAVEDCRSRDEAADVISGLIPEIRAAAEDIVAGYGKDYEVTVNLSEEHYPERTYENCCFPSGNYLSLSVNIGEAVGQNWWCVLFPPMCMSAARTAAERKKSNEEMLAEVGLTPDQYKVITESESKTKYRVRFRILEILDDLFG